MLLRSRSILSIVFSLLSGSHLTQPLLLIGVCNIGLWEADVEGYEMGKRVMATKFTLVSAPVMTPW